MTDLLSDRIREIVVGIAEEPEEFWNERLSRYIGSLPIAELDQVVIDEPAEGVSCNFDKDFIKVFVTQTYLNEFMED